MTTLLNEAPPAAPRRTRLGARTVLQSLWVFAMFNYLYCDVMSLMDSDSLRGYLAGDVGGTHITEGFLLGAAFLMEIPMAMVLVSRLAPFRWSRAANLGAGAVMTLVQAATLLAGRPTSFYVFFSVIEISATLCIVWLAWRWTG
jgi:hypothetical protein